MSTTPANPGTSAKRVPLGYLCAVMLPCAATWISLHVAPLHNIPMALSLVSIAGIATFFDAGAILLSIVSAAVIFNIWVAPPRGSWSLDADALVGTVVLMGAGMLIALLSHKTRSAEDRLRTALRSLQEQTDALIQAQQGSKSAAWVFDTRTRNTTWYRGGSEIFGRSLEEISALGSPTSLVLEEDRPKIAAAAAHTERTGEPFQVEFRVLWPNGEVHWLEASGTPVAGDKRYWRGVSIDISGRKFAELALVRSEKLAAAARLASSIAHEINNPLESLTNLIYLAKLSAAGTEARAYIDAAEKEVSRIAHVTRQRLRFYRQPSIATETDVVEALREIASLFENRFSQQAVSFQLEAGDPPPLLCRAMEIRQVLSSLIENALDATPRGGCVRIRLRRGTDWRTGFAGLRITVADSGCGMSATTLKRIYEPFFSTKDGLGAGLGLWVAAEIVESHGGSLKVRSSTGPRRRGSVFSLILPYAEPFEKAPSNPAPAELQ